MSGIHNSQVSSAPSIPSTSMSSKKKTAIGITLLVVGIIGAAIAAGEGNFMERFNHLDHGFKNIGADMGAHWPAYIITALGIGMLTYILFSKKNSFATEAPQGTSADLSRNIFTEASQQISAPSIDPDPKVFPFVPTKLKPIREEEEEDVLDDDSLPSGFTHGMPPPQGSPITRHTSVSTQPSSSATSSSTMPASWVGVLGTAPSEDGLADHYSWNVPDISVPSLSDDGLPDHYFWNS